jgi:diguanylate cyclase (GGDEF)-like protein/PAS domain S-box-containing protein
MGKQPNEAMANPPAQKTGLIHSSESQQALLLEVFDASRVAMVVTDGEGNYIRVNSAFCDLLGYAQSEILGRSYLEFTLPDDRPSDSQAIEGIKAHGHVHVREKRYLRKDGVAVKARVQSLVTRDRDGRPMMALGIMEDITELTVVQESFEYLFALSMDGIMITEPETGKVINANESALKMLGLTQNDLPFRREQIVDLTDPRLKVALTERRTQGRFRGEMRYRRANGETFEVEATSSVHRGTTGTQIASITFRDITERKRAERDLQESEAQLRRSEERRLIATNSGRIAIWEVELATDKLTWDENCFALYKIPKERFEGTFDAWTRSIHPQDLAAVTTSFQKAVDGLGEYNTTFRILWPDGATRFIEAHGTVVRDQNGTAERIVGTNWDVTESKQHQSQLERLAHFDALTQLPNRLLLSDRLNQAMGQVRRRAKKLAVAYIDLDGFKSVNDTHGHSVGDRFLIAQAQAIKGCLREGDTLARIGGDEFVAVFMDLDNLDACESMLDRILLAASAKVVDGDLVLKGSASIGVTLYPQAQDMDADQLLRQADQAMYQAKLMGRNRYNVFDSDQDSHIRGHHESVENIRLALQRQEFVLHYQPKVNMRTGQVIGAEALIRWQHPEKGLLAPGLFLPVIEHDPLAIVVGEWVLETALNQIERWQANGLTLSVSINMGARQLQQKDFIERLRMILSTHTDAVKGNIELEVLETSALEDITQISQVIDTCAQMGVAFALDDFGTGYSSLTYLKRLKVALLKIDQSFVRDMLEDPDDLAILEGVIGLASAFKRKVIAEGVETVAHGTALLALGCEMAQGYGIARPMPPELMPGWVATWQPDVAWTESPPSE